MLWSDGSPYLEPRFPHARDPGTAARIYEDLCRRGIWVRGTNVLRDKAEAGGSAICNSTAMTEVDPAFIVDQNVWLLERQVLLEHPIPERFSPEEIAAGTCPDDKMLESLLRNGIDDR